MFDPNAHQAGQYQEPAAAYGQVNQGQIPQIAQQFIQRFAGVNDPRAQQYARMDPNQVNPGQLAEMHQYAAQNHPGILGEVMSHPMITTALGSFAAYELHKHMQGRQ
ncbi:MAG: hypothetical protein PVSMB4_13050 [Ktedonobacterales bacterium]